jgi:LPS-assembly protein
VRKSKVFIGATAALLLGTALPALAQTSDGAPTAGVPVESEPQSYDVDFSADTLGYDNLNEIVTARGKVLMLREGSRLEADEVIWNRKTGQVKATGNVRIRNPGGDIAYGDAIELTDTLKDGVVDNLLIVLADGGRLVADKGNRSNTITQLDRAAYTPCRVVDDSNCPKDPVWQINALQVTHDPAKNRISYKGARLQLFGVPLVTLPGFSHPADNRGGTGFLIPDIQYSRNNGFEIALPYYKMIDRNRDFTLTPHIYTEALPALEGKYRALTGNGAYQVGGFVTYGSRLPAGTVGVNSQRDFRGYLDGSGKFQLDPQWSVKGSLRVVTDRTFLRRYDISRDDTLRSNVEIERIKPSSYFSVSGWGFQTLRPAQLQGSVPIALPIIDYRQRLDGIAGGRAELQLNSISIARTAGQDTQRAFAGARWDLRRIIPGGQEIVLTGYARGDVYHTDEIASTTTALYRGQARWSGRLIGAAAAEIRWPFIGQLGAGTQRLTPRLQLVSSPTTSNLRIPNEDARAVDLEDSNLFSLNRFPGYDRWENGTRLTYGLDWGLDLPGFSISTNIGQSYRLTSKPTLFPDGTGLTGRTSDLVGRTTIKFKRLVSFSHRYRLDKDNFAIRRNEIDATIGTDQTYVTAGYLRLNRNIGPTLEDLRDREEIRLGGRIKVARYWSIFGSTIVDLTDRREDITSINDGFEPIRHRLGVAYDDDCLRLSLTWKRDYDPSGDARRGNTYQIRISFKNIGF